MAPVIGWKAGCVEPKETAFYYLKATIAQEYISKWTNSLQAKQNIRWIEELREALSPYTTGDYVNWPDRYIEDWLKTYYGKNVHRLRKVKTKYDPDNVFKFPQSIPPL